MNEKEAIKLKDNVIYAYSFPLGWVKDRKEILENFLAHYANYQEYSPKHFDLATIWDSQENKVYITPINLVGVINHLDVFYKESYLKETIQGLVKLNAEHS